MGVGNTTSRLVWREKEKVESNRETGAASQRHRRRLGNPFPDRSGNFIYILRRFGGRAERLLGKSAEFLGGWQIASREFLANNTLRFLGLVGEFSRDRQYLAVRRAPP
jgi:hypothetical protein